MSEPFDSTRRRRHPAINITPLIDVVFLLLIFFMVSSTFKEHQGLDIALPSAQNAKNQEIGAKEIAVDRQGRFYLEGVLVDESGLRQGLAALLAEQPGAPLVLRADKNAGFGRVVRVIDIAREVGGTHLIIPTDLLEALPPLETLPPQP